MMHYAMHRRYGTVYRYDDRRVWFWSDYTEKWAATPGDGDRMAKGLANGTLQKMTTENLTKEQIA